MNQRKIPPLLRHFTWSRWSLWNVESRRFLDAPNKTVPSPSSGSVEMTLDVMAHERRCSLFAERICRRSSPTLGLFTTRVHTTRRSLSWTANVQCFAQHAANSQHEYENRAAFVMPGAKARSSKALDYSPPTSSSSPCISRHAHQSLLGGVTSPVVTL